MIRIVLILLFMCAIVGVRAQKNAKIDSFKNIIETARHDTTKIKALLQWDNLIYISDPKLDLKLNQRVKQLCETNLNRNLTDIEKAFFTIKLAATYNNIGLIYGDQGDYAKASAFYHRSLKIKEDIGDKKGIASSLNNIGNIYQKQGDYDKASAFYHRSLTIKEEIGNKQGIASSLNNIGLIYNNQGDYARAIDYYTRSLAIKEEIGDKLGIGNSLVNIGIIYSEQGDYDSAIVHFTRSLTIREEMGDKRGIASSLFSIGSIHMRQGDYTSAIAYNTRALTIAQEVDAAIEIRKVTNTLYEAYKATGRLKPALEMYELYITTRDSIDSDENQKEVMRQAYKYEYEKQSLADSLAHAAEQERSELVMKEQEARLSQEKAQKIGFGIGGGLALVLAIVAVFAFVSKRKDNKLIQKQKEEVERQKTVAEQQKELVEEKNTEIMDSITYAKRIQTAILPPKKVVKEYLKESFILYKPKDIVAGDFYWIESVDDQVIFAAADCTGHGVPGAMVSVVCHNAMNRAVREFGLRNPAEILDKTRELVIETFDKSESEVKDGMDIALCALDLKTLALKYSGANNPLWIVRKELVPLHEISEEQPYEENNPYVIEIKADIQPIGKHAGQKPFTGQDVQLFAGDTIFIFTDGFPDQFGGPKGKKFKYKPFKELLLANQGKPMEEQKQLLDESIENWRGELEQVDDICIIGVKV